MQSLIGKSFFFFYFFFFLFFLRRSQLVIFFKFTPYLGTHARHSWVHHDALLRWIQDKKTQHASAAEQAAPMPVPLEESAIQREMVLQRHLSGFTPQQLR